MRFKNTVEQKLWWSHLSYFENDIVKLGNSEDILFITIFLEDFDNIT